MMNSLILAFLVLGMAGRERGQGHGWLGTTGARVLFWAVPVALTCLALGVDKRLAIGAGVAAFLGLILVPHGAGQNLAVPWKEPADGSWPEDDRLYGICLPERLGYLLSAGIVRCWLLSVPLGVDYANAGWLPVAGVVLPLGYLAGLYLPKLPWRLTRATEWGEFISFGGIGAAMAAVVLGG